MGPRAFLRRLVSGLVADGVDDLGAMLAFYGLLAVFPMLVFVVTLALVALPARAITDALTLAAPALPPSAYDLIRAQVARMQDSAAATGFLIGGAAFALWGASRGVSALILALDRVLGLEETRSWLRRQVLAIALTAVVAMMSVVAMALLFIGPTVGHWLADRWGLGATFDLVWTVGRWIAGGLLVLGVFVILYRFLPDWRASTRDVMPGAVVGVALWLVASRLLGLYVAVAANYDRTYGTLAGTIVVLVWMWLSAMTVLVGAEIDQVLLDHRDARIATARTRAAAASNRGSDHRTSR